MVPLGKLKRWSKQGDIPELILMNTKGLSSPHLSAQRRLQGSRRKKQIPRSQNE